MGTPRLKCLLADFAHQAHRVAPRCQRLIRNQKNSVAGKFGDELLGIRLRLFGIDVKLLADLVADNFPQRSAAVGSLEDGGCDLVQREESGIGRVHHHHFAGQRAGGNGGTARDVNAIFRHAGHPWKLWSKFRPVPHPGIRIERQAANGNPGDEIAGSGEKLFHQAWSSAKNRILRIRRRTASADDNSSMRFSGPCSRKTERRRERCSSLRPGPVLPAKGVPKAE
jgi:hypothetical protein